MLAYVAGIAPRSEAYMRRHWDHAKGFIDDAALEQARADEREAWLAAQRAAGLGLVGPSYVETEDILRPLTQVAGSAAGPLTRTFETNTFHRRPELRRPLPTHGLDAWIDRIAPAGDWVAALPSPYDAVVRSDVADDETAWSVAIALNQAARRALAKGARLVRFQEPSAGYRNHALDGERLRGLLEAATAGIHNAAVVHFTQADLAARPELVDAVPCRGIGFDAHASGAVDLGDKQVHVGVIDGQSSLVEETQSVATLQERAGGRLFAITNGWDLEHVPFDVALAKLYALGRARLVEAA